jgi:alcohol dehydrogenase
MASLILLISSGDIKNLENYVFMDVKCVYVVKYMTTESIYHKALIYSSAGTNRMLWKNDLPKPKVGKDQVLIKVISAGLNPVDYKITKITPMYMGRKNTVVGSDVCGVVQEVGSRAVGVNVGDTVFGLGYGLSEYTVTDAKAVAKLPEGVATDVAGSFGVAPLTAYQMIKSAHGFEGTEPKTIIVIGASGGVGSCAVQIARAKCPAGSKIYAVSSAKNFEFVKSLGADEIIDYSKSDFVFKTCLPAKSVDIVLDCVSSPDDHNYVPEGMTLIKEKTGKYVAIHSASSFDWVKLFLGKALGINLFRGQYSMIICEPNKEDLIDIGKLASAGKLKMHVQEYIPFEESAIRKAFETLQNRRVKGKLVVKISQ